MQAARSHNSTRVSPSIASPRTAAPAAGASRAERPLRVVLHGVEGVGKSTFASQAPAPIFLCAEDGTGHLDVARVPAPAGFADVLEAVRVLTYEEHGFQTLVIDTIDWLEPLIFQHVCHLLGVAHIDDVPYGKGYQAAVEQWRVLVGRLEMLVRTRKMNVIMLAHSAARRLESEQGTFDRFQLKLGEKAAEVLRGWADVVLFARHEVVRVSHRGAFRGQTTGARVVHTGWSRSFDARNRFDLPETLPLSWEALAEPARAHVPTDVAAVRAELLELIPRLSEALKASQVMREWAGDDPVRLVQLLERVRSKIALEGGGEGLEVPPGNSQAARAAG
jgi:hypothetical protein